MSDLPISQLFYTSRSAYETQRFCDRKYWLSQHFGPTGYGIQPERRSIPLATGSSVHAVLQPILQWVSEHDQLPPDEIVMAAALAELEKYRQKVAAHGLSYWSADEAAYQRMIQEQEHLLVGLPLLWVWHQLPIILADRSIFLVEPREVSVYACTCGYGDGIQPVDEHIRRGCQGLGLQTGPDFIAQHRTTLSYEYWEGKTRGAPLTDAWAESYETRVQVQLGTLGVEQKYGIEIENVYLYGLCKGQYRKSKELGEYQDSRLTWAWRKPADPPLQAEEWAYKYEWWDESEQRMRRLGKGWQRAWVGEFEGGLPAWVRHLTPDVVKDVLRVVGPLPRNQVIKRHALKQWINKTYQNRQAVLHIWQELEKANFDWTAAPVQDLLDWYFGQSWDCQRFGRRYKCEMAPICHRDSGWQDPFSIGFVPRRPHHPGELEQAVARGLIPAEEEYESDDAL